MLIRSLILYKKIHEKGDPKHAVPNGTAIFLYLTPGTYGPGWNILSRRDKIRKANYFLQFIRVWQDSVHQYVKNNSK